MWARQFNYGTSSIITGVLHSIRNRTASWSPRILPNVPRRTFLSSSAGYTRLHYPGQLHAPSGDCLWGNSNCWRTHHLHTIHPRDSPCGEVGWVQLLLCCYKGEWEWHRIVSSLWRVSFIVVENELCLCNFSNQCCNMQVIRSYMSSVYVVLEECCTAVVWNVCSSYVFQHLSMLKQTTFIRLLPT